VDENTFNRDIDGSIGSISGTTAGAEPVRNGRPGETGGPSVGPGVERPVPARASRGDVTRRGLLLGSITGTAGFAITSPGVVLPDVADAFAISDDATAWVLAAFVLGSGVMMALTGRALDLFGSRFTSILGTVLTLVSVPLIVFSHAFAGVVVGRFVAGMASGVLCVTAFSAVSYIPLGDRARASGVLTATSFTCISVGPLVGALLGETLGWRSALAVGLLTCLPVPLMLRGMPAERRVDGRLDLQGAGLATVGLVGLAAVLQAPATGMDAGVAAAIAAVAAAALVLLGRHLLRHPTGFLPLSVLRNRTLMELSFTAATIQAVFTGLSFAAPILLAREAGWSALQTGIALAPCALFAATSASLAGSVGARRPAASTFSLLCAISAAGALLAGLLSGRPALVIVGAIVAIVPYAAVQAAMIGKVSTLVAPDEIGAATGTFLYIFITGGAVGPAVTGGLASLSGFGAAVALLAVWPIAGLLVLARVRARGVPRIAS
jgi:MFS family permease